MKASVGSARLLQKSRARDLPLAQGGDMEMIVPRKTSLRRRRWSGLGKPCREKSTLRTRKCAESNRIFLPSARQSEEKDICSSSAPLGTGGNK